MSAARPSVQRTGTGLGPWVLVGLGLVVLALAVYLLWPGGVGGASDAPASGSEGPAPSSAASLTPAPEASATDAPSSGPPPDAEPGTPESAGSAATPSSTATRPSSSGSLPPIRSTVSAGDGCTWLERDLVVTGADGQRLVCLGDGSDTRWVAED